MSSSTKRPSRKATPKIYFGEQERTTCSVPDILGNVIRVKFVDGQEYDGVVKRYNAKEQLHYVYYDIDKSTEKHNFIDGTSDYYCSQWKVVSDSTAALKVAPFPAHSTLTFSRSHLAALPVSTERYLLPNTLCATSFEMVAGCSGRT